MKFKVGDIVKIRDDLTTTGNYGSFPVVESMYKYKDKTATIIRVSNIGSFYDLDIDNGWHGWTDKMLEPVEYVLSLKEAEESTRVIYPDGGLIYADGGLIPTPSKPISIEEQLGLPKGVSIHDLNPIEWYRPSIDLVFNVEQAKELAKRIKEKLSDDEFKRVRGSKADHIYFDETIFKEDKSMKFTFYTKEGYRIDKSNNSKVETITTYVNGILLSGEATCDKTDYDERQGVLEALANAVSDGDFDKVYRKAVKANKRADEVKRTCKYCGKTFNTIEEKEAEEAWHVERRKARHERYLLRKRAKQIAFEEAAQKMAKDIIKNEK